MKNNGKGIRNELILGLVAIILVSGIVTHVVILVCSRYNFDTLVRKSDIEIAQSVAESIAPYYGLHGSWTGIESEIGKLRLTLLRPPVAVEENEDGRHVRGGGIPLVVTNTVGVQVFPAGQGGDNKYEHGEKRIERYRPSDGVSVLLNGRIVGCVFFKSMLRSNYNPHEAAFIASLIASIGMSVLIGVALAILLGSVFASKFVRPVIDLDEAVRRIATGEAGVRAEKKRDDEIGRLADNFNAMAQQIETTEITRKNLLADVAHELRTPVSIIQANLEMIIAGVYTADQERLKSLYDETRILTDLIGNLREISDLEMGIISLNSQPVRIYSLLVETCMKYQPLFEERGIEISIQFSVDENIYVVSDEDRLRQVLRNILMNALKYAPEKTSVVISGTQVKDDDNFLRIIIADEGPGVPEKDLGKIFERFYRVDSSRNRDSGGRGLGLAICKQFIDASGGTIFARNVIPHGLEVCFDIPICKDKK